MNCWYCKAELHYEGDQAIDEQIDRDGIAQWVDNVATLSCPKCDSYVVVYHPLELYPEDRE